MDCFQSYRAAGGGGEETDKGLETLKSERNRYK